MSFQGQPSGPVHPDFQNHQGEIKNNNKQGLCITEVDSDSNANEVQDLGGTGDMGAPPPLVSQMEEQDKVIIWGTDSQCDDPDLEEFEMLECQELEAYLVEEEEEYRRETASRAGDGRLLDGRPMPCSSVAPLGITEKHERYEEAGRKDKCRGQDPESTVSLSVENQENKAELSSENDVFVSCLSTLSSLGGSLASALDGTSQAKTAESRPVPSQTICEDLTSVSQSISTVSVRCSTLQETKDALGNSGGSTIQPSCTDVNLNSTVLPQENKSSEAQLEQQKRSPSVDVLHSLTNGAGKGQSHTERRDHMTAVGHEEVYKQREETQEGQRKENPPCPADSTRLAVTSAGERPIVEAQDSRGSPTPGTGSRRPGPKVSRKPSQEREMADVNSNPVKTDPRGGPGEPRPLRKQGSFELSRSASPSSLEKKNQLARKPWGSPTRAVTPPPPKTTGSPRRRPHSSPAKSSTAAKTSQVECPDSSQGGSSVPKSLGKGNPSSGIPKPILQHPPKPTDKVEPDNRNTRSPPPHYPPKPKNVRPKIITYIRKSPQVKPHAPDAPYEIATLPTRLAPYPSPLAGKEPKSAGHHPKATPVLSAANLLYDKYRHEMQKACYFAPALVVSGIKPPGHPVPHTLSGKTEGFYGELPDKYLQEMGRGATVALGVPSRDDPTGPPILPQEAAGPFRSPRTLRPQLGLGAVTRLPSAKNRMLLTSQRSPLTFNHPTQMANQPSQCYQESPEASRACSDSAPRSLLPKPGQSGLRPPGYSRLPAPRLTALGFVRSTSVSSVSSNQSVDSTHSDPCRPSQRASSGCEDVPLQRAPPSSEGSRGPSTPATTRRPLIPPPRGSPVAARKEIQRDTDSPRSASSSPKRFSVVSPKPLSPVHTRQKPAASGGAAVRSGTGGSPRRDGGESERLQVQRLRERCEEQAQQLQSSQAELKRANLGLEVFAITTQHFYHKSEAAVLRERELSLELSRIRDEVAFTVCRWERVQRDKEALERRCEQERRRLQERQEAELGALEERLRAQQQAERERLSAQHSSQIQELRTQLQEQMEEMNLNHDSAMVELENNHSVAMATQQEEHAKTVRDLIAAHEHQRRALEEEFEKLRLSLQDQVDTLTFQNRSLRDRAKRFEEALRRSTDEQIVDALAPYQHVQEDLKSLKEVLEMKNQQIHEQEIKIAELEKMAQKNVLLEERVQVLQQQNEDLRARIDRNLAMSRQLSEENANLQEYVEKESNEKKRLSRTNEELLWRLQTGELSPRMSPSASPIHRASPGPASPSRIQPYPASGPASPSRIQPYPASGPASPSRIQPFPR